MSIVENNKKRRFLSGKWISLYVILATLCIFFIALPYVAKNAILSWLNENGADSASIKSLSYNPFMSKVTMDGLDVVVGDKVLLHNGEMEIDVSLLSLFRKNIRLEKVVYKDFFIDMEQKNTGAWRFGFYRLENNQEQPEVTESEGLSTEWGLLADHVILEDVTVNLKMEDFNFNVVIKEAELKKFATREDYPSGTLTLKGSVNNEPILLDLDIVRLAPDLRLAGDIAIDRFQLTELNKLLADVLPIFSGDIGLKGKAEYLQSDINGIEVKFDGNIATIKPAVGNSGFVTRASELSWQGKVFFGMADVGPMVVETDGLLSSKEFDLELPDVELTTSEKAIDLKGKTKVFIDENVAVEYNGTLDLNTIGFALPSFSLQNDSIGWQGKVVYDSGVTDKPQTVATKGKLQIGQLLSELLEAKLVAFQKSITLDTDLSLSIGEQFGVSGQSSLLLEDVFVQEKESQKKLVSIGVITLPEIIGKGGQAVDVNSLAIETAALSVPGGMPLEITLPSLRVGSIATKDLQSIVIGNLNISEINASSSRTGIEFAKIGSILGDSIEVNGESLVELQAIAVKDIFLVEPLGTDEEKRPLQLANIKVQNLRFDTEKGLDIERVSLDSFASHLEISSEGELILGKHLESFMEPQAEGELDEEKGESLAIRIKEITLHGDNIISFEDNSLKVPFATKLKIDKLLIADIDSTNTEKPAKIDLQAVLDDRAPLTVEGDLAPLSDPMRVDLVVDFKNYPLAKLSSYTIESVGTKLSGGQLFVKSDVKLNGNDLDLANKVSLKKLETTTMSKELAAELDNELPIPLDKAISILRDSDDNIGLDIPISGPLDDLGVGISDILITAISKAIVPAATGYLVYTLGPYGALAYVGMKAGEHLLKVQLPPVEFTPKKTDMIQDYSDYFSRVSIVLTERPDTDLQLCPLVGGWELIGMEKMEKLAKDSDAIVAAILKEESLSTPLFELGQKRGESVRDALVSNHGIDVKRLLICDTKITADKEQKPSVMVQM